MKKQKPLKTEGNEDPKKSTAKKTEEDPEKSFDFGGIPKRDLKKNLGCG